MDSFEKSSLLNDIAASGARITDVAQNRQNVFIVELTPPPCNSRADPTEASDIKPATRIMYPTSGTFRSMIKSSCSSFVADECEAGKVVA
mmetsp:Transcript_28642/g.65466  ORF Transcript_28642/g.65466 Transcript_28642/m.65466 type:complete len:90 (-) Transcript_28642:1032-1301(-)